MLILSRRLREGVLVTDGTSEIRVFIFKSSNSVVKIGVDSPDEFRITRIEYDEVKPEPEA